MNAGEIVLIPFPFSELSQVKVRPAVLINELSKFKSILLAMIR